MKVLLALVLAAVVQPQAQQFDLICTSKHHDATFHYRVDLSQRLWCATSETKDIWGKRAEDDRCAPVLFSGIGSDILLFDGLDPYHYVDRVTGEWYYKSGGELYRGTCSPAPFSDFPKLGVRF